MKKTYIAAYTECPACETEIPANFEFEDEEYSNTLRVRCPECGREFNTELALSLYLTVNGEDKGSTVQHVR